MAADASAAQGPVRLGLLFHRVGIYSRPEATPEAVAPQLYAHDTSELPPVNNWVRDASLKARPRFLDEYEDPEPVTVSEDEAGEVEAAGATAAAGVLAGITTVAIVVGTAAGGVEVWTVAGGVEVWTAAGGVEVVVGC
jgi:hypothetical protein